MIFHIMHSEQMKAALHADNGKNRQNGEKASEKHNFMNRVAAADIFDDDILNGKNKPAGYNEQDAGQGWVLCQGCEFYHDWVGLGFICFFLLRKRFAPVLLNLLAGRYNIFLIFFLSFMKHPSWAFQYWIILN